MGWEGGNSAPEGVTPPPALSMSAPSVTLEESEGGPEVSWCSLLLLAMMMDEKEGSLVRTLVSGARPGGGGGEKEEAAAWLGFDLDGSRADTEEVLLSSPWLRKSGGGEEAEWKEEESSRALFPPWEWGRCEECGGGEGAVSPES